MKAIAVLLALMLSWLLPAVTAFALNVQRSVELTGAYASPYPPVLSPALERLPPGAVTVNAGNVIFYYAHGVFYQKVMLDQKYVIVPPPIGAVVYAIPPGWAYVFIDGISYYVSGGVYYERRLEGYRVAYPPVAYLPGPAGAF
ncbi:MAG: hypothetical protein KGK03_03215 [Candidatus Omnitrophica bacterium]|nr:hypothetical protein [Candidatus Omnitrophota bacterium]MDE2222062.1 hypothetical protein [Candidatus Omnitrophota bacterium]